MPDSWSMIIPYSTLGSNYEHLATIVTSRITGDRHMYVRYFEFYIENNEIVHFSTSNTGVQSNPAEGYMFQYDRHTYYCIPLVM